MNTHQFFLVLTVSLLKVRIKTSTRSLFSCVIPLCLFLICAGYLSHVLVMPLLQVLTGVYSNCESSAALLNLWTSFSVHDRCVVTLLTHFFSLCVAFAACLIAMCVTLCCNDTFAKSVWI